MKKVVSFMLALAMTAALCACGKAEETPSAEEKTQAEETQKKEPETTAEVPSGDAGEEGFVVGFANVFVGNTWRAQYVADAEAMAEKLKGEGRLRDFIVTDADNDVSKQITQINNMIDEGVDAIIITPVSATSLGTVIERAQNEGIVVVIAGDPAAYEGTYFVGGDNESFAQLNIEWLVDKLDGKGDIVELTGVEGNSADKIRVDIYKDVLSGYPDIHVLASAPASWNATEAQSVMSTFLSTFDNIDGVLQQDVTAPGVLMAYKNAGKEPGIMIGDATYGFLRAWAENETLDCVAYATHPGQICDALNVTMRLLEGYQLDESILVVNPLDDGLKNTILLEPPYIVTNEAQPDAPWMSRFKYAKSISVDEAVALGEGLSDADTLDGWMSQEQIDTFFLK